MPLSSRRSRWRAATARMNPSVIREILKITERPGIISLAGGLPSADTFPVEAMREATARVLRDAPREALQYAASEGYGPLREWVAAHIARTRGCASIAAQVLITTGSQQGLDLVGKVLIDAGSRVLVETPTYLGALQAFAPYEPDARRRGLATTKGRCPTRSPPRRRRRALPVRAAELPEPDAAARMQRGAPRRARRRRAAARACRWSRTTRTATSGTTRRRRAARRRAGPKACSTSARSRRCSRRACASATWSRRRRSIPKLLQAKQAADLHTPSFNQRIVHEVMKSGFLDAHVPTIRARYRAQRDAMAAALRRAHDRAWRTWTRAGRRHVLLARAAARASTRWRCCPRRSRRGVAFVPGAPFYASAAAAGHAAAVVRDGAAGEDRGWGGGACRWCCVRLEQSLPRRILTRSSSSRHHPVRPPLVQDL